MQSRKVRNTNFFRSHFLFILEFSISDRFFSYLGQGILIFLDPISCLFWSSVCPTVFFSFLGQGILTFLDCILSDIPNSKIDKKCDREKLVLLVPKYEKKRLDIPNSKIKKKCNREKLVFLVPRYEKKNGRTYRTQY
jgi:hypothetical protein